MDTSGNTKMSIEQKAKAYEMALEAARKELGVDRKEWEIIQRVLHNIFPELRESEDENLKNKSGYYKAGKFWKASTLWNAVKGKSPQKVPNRYILQECTWNISSLQHFADEVKNVQEVDLNYPIILDMNGNILDGAHRVVKAYLEGKDIDIVYLGDDEWPEPDYDEEKAVKESEDERIRKSLIKFLTDIKEISESGRTTWAIRKEDAEMCKSFIAYLEKQKEQKPDDDPLDDPKFLKGFDTGREVQRIFDEQKPAEWSEEDEKHIDICIKALKEWEMQDSEDFSTTISWLKSLRSRPKSSDNWKPQPKEEGCDYITPNKEFFQWIYDRLVYVHKENPNVDYMRSFKKRIDNSVFDQYHWKPSEDEERLINTSTSFLKDFADKGYENAVECIDWLKSKLNGNIGK